MISPNFLGLVVRDEYQGQDLLLFDFARSEADLAETVTTPETLWFGRARRQELFRSLLLRTQLMEGGNLNFVSPAERRTGGNCSKPHLSAFPRSFPLEKISSLTRST